MNPDVRTKLGSDRSWSGAKGLAEDVRYYGEWMKQEAFRRIGHLYPKVQVPAEQGGGEATVIAWIWARTVKCPNPACGCEMPLASSFVLSKKKGKEAWIELILTHDGIEYVIQYGKCPKEKEKLKFGKEHLSNVPFVEPLQTKPIFMMPLLISRPLLSSWRLLPKVGTGVFIFHRMTNIAE